MGTLIVVLLVAAVGLIVWKLVETLVNDPDKNDDGVVDHKDVVVAAKEVAVEAKAEAVKAVEKVKKAHAKKAK